MSELKACPFCNDKAEVLLNGDTVSIQCSGSFCGMSSVHGPSWDYKATVEAWNTRASGWISVDDELPEASGAYWTFNDDPSDVFKQRVRMYYDDNKQFNSGRVTHWMPLPEHPKGSL